MKNSQNKQTHKQTSKQANKQRYQHWGARVQNFPASNVELQQKVKSNQIEPYCEGDKFSPRAECSLCHTSPCAQRATLTQ